MKVFTGAAALGFFAFFFSASSRLSIAFRRSANTLFSMPLRLSCPDQPKTADNPLLASLLKAKGKPVGQIHQEETSTQQTKLSADKDGPPSTDPVRIIADRRRGGDRRTTTERRKGAERRVNKFILCNSLNYFRFCYN